MACCPRFYHSHCCSFLMWAEQKQFLFIDIGAKHMNNYFGLLNKSCNPWLSHYILENPIQLMCKTLIGRGSGTHSLRSWKAWRHAVFFSFEHSKLLQWNWPSMCISCNKICGRKSSRIFQRTTANWAVSDLISIFVPLICFAGTEVHFQQPV